MVMSIRTGRSLCSVCTSKGATNLVRAFTTNSPALALETQTTSGSSPPPPSPPSPQPAQQKKRRYVPSKRGRVPIETGTLIGSRRRRVALASSQNIPFSLLPYQCFQEARKIIAADRVKKIEKIEEERRRIAAVTEADAATMGGEAVKKGRLMKMEQHLESLKVLADINDPLVKKKFEDGLGDMSRPIYRQLARDKWLQMKRKIMIQRLDQMHVVPDLVPFLDPQADISISFGRRKVAPGAIVPSLVSTVPPRLDIQLFDKGAKTVCIAVVDPDIPNLEKDSFDFRCHFLAANIPIDPTNGRIVLAALNKESQVILDWLPPHAQKGTPWHRLAIFILEQPQGHTINVAAAREKEVRMGFNTRSWITRSKTSILSATLFRNEWDEGTRTVMRRAGIEGEDIEWKRKPGEKLPYKKKDGARYR